MLQGIFLPPLMKIGPIKPINTTQPAIYQPDLIIGPPYVNHKKKTIVFIMLYRPFLLPKKYYTRKLLTGKHDKKSVFVALYILHMLKKKAKNVCIR